MTQDLEQARRYAECLHLPTTYQTGKGKTLPCSLVKMKGRIASVLATHGDELASLPTNTQKVLGRAYGVDPQNTPLHTLRSEIESRYRKAWAWLREPVASGPETNRDRVTAWCYEEAPPTPEKRDTPRATPPTDVSVPGSISIDLGPLSTYVDAKISEALETYKPEPSGPTYTTYIIEDRIKNETRTVEDPTPVYWETLLRNGQLRQNTLLVGPTGCGKTHVARMASKALGLRFFALSVSGGTTESDFSGRYLPTGDGGRFEFVKAMFADFYADGGVFLVDEWDAGDPNVKTFVNAAIANGHMSLPSGEVLEKHPDFWLIAAANTWGHGADRQYCGRMQEDAATHDRFVAGQITVDYDPHVEESMVRPDVLAWGRRIRDSIRSKGLRRVMSTRVMIDLSRMEDAFQIGQSEWERSYFADWTTDDIKAVGGK